jgi:hypothetical protein
MVRFELTIRTFFKVFTGSVKIKGFRSLPVSRSGTSAKFVNDQTTPTIILMFWPRKHPERSL